MDRLQCDVDFCWRRSKPVVFRPPAAASACRSRRSAERFRSSRRISGPGCFIGHSRQLTLTEAGRSYVVACKRILEDVEEAERAASGEYSAPKGDLTITAPIVFGRLHVLPVVMDFLKAYPDIDIRIVQADRVVNLLEEHIDLAVRIGELPDSSLVATRVGSIRRVVCGSPAYFAERGTPKSPGELGAPMTA